MICFVSMFIPSPYPVMPKIYMVICIGLGFLTYMLSNLDYDTRMKDLLRIPEKNIKKS